MLFHAGMIAAALGDDANAVSLLEQALAINPHFSPLHAPIAHAKLESLSPAGQDAGHHH